MNDLLPEWHVFFRGIRGTPLYCVDFDRSEYLALVRKHAREYGTEVRMYTLQETHPHFLMGGERTDVGRFFHRIHSKFARRFNRRHELKGHIFESDFRPLAIRSPEHRVNTFLYILLNPVKDYGIAHPSEYPWCGYRAIADPAAEADWLNPAPVLRTISPDPDEARAKIEQALAVRIEQIRRLRDLKEPGKASWPGQAAEEPLYEWSNAELRFILPTLVDFGLSSRLSGQARLPPSAFNLYVASKLNLASVRRLCLVLGIRRSTGWRWIHEIEEDAFLSRALAGTNAMLPPGSLGSAA